VNPVAWILGLGLVALLYLAIPMVALAIVASLVARRRSRRLGLIVGGVTMAGAVLLAPWVNFGLEGASWGNVTFTLALYAGQIALVPLLGALFAGICIWVWRRLTQRSSNAPTSRSA
jgi:hypothetical protein